MKHPIVLSVLLSFLLSGAVLPQGGVLSGEKSNTVRPVEYTGPIRNPLRGFRGHQTSTKNEWSTVGKYYVGWNELEDNESDGVEKIINWTNAHFDGVEKNNIKIVPRVWLDFPGRAPAWPDDMTVGDFTSEQFKTRVKALIKKLGKAWDQDPRIAYIEMGIIGKWGEHHSPFPTKEMNNILAKSFSSAFKNIMALRNHPDELIDYNFGIYWDSFAHADEVDTHKPIMLALGDYWKTAIIQGETAYNWGNYKIQPGDSPDNTLMDTTHRYFLEDLIWELHCSGLGWVSNYNASITAIKAGADEVQKTFGYRFVIDEFVYPEKIEPGKPFNVSFSVINKGAAPFYYDWPVELSLLDADKNAVWKQVFSNVDIRKWYPGDVYNIETREYQIKAVKNSVSTSFVLDDSIKNGIYTIAIAILDPAGDLPSLRFAIDNYFEGGRHPMGNIGLGVTPATFKINPDDFDDMHADHSLHYILTK